MGQKEQLFVNDYTRIRNHETSMYVANKAAFVGWLGESHGGPRTGSVAVDVSQHDWDKWAYFPNTKQLRNQYVANTKLGYPMCLSTCSPPGSMLVNGVIDYVV